MSQIPPEPATSLAVRLFLAALGIVSLGATIGFLTGSSGPDSTVLAALLPAILSILGGGAAAAILVKKPRIRNELILAGGAGLTAFSLARLIRETTRLSPDFERAGGVVQRLCGAGV